MNIQCNTCSGTSVLRWQAEKVAWRVELTVLRWGKSRAQRSYTHATLHFIRSDRCEVASESGWRILGLCDRATSLDVHIHF